jgi:acyl-CoA synthetase (AMP-forming)/AMP-acid ligase II
MLMDNCNEIVELKYALSKVGAWMVPLNFRYDSNDLQFFIRHSDSTFVVYHDIFEDKVTGAVSGISELKDIICVGEGKKENRLAYEEIVQSGSEEEPQVEVGMNDIQAIMYTSGSTGEPKGAMISHGNWIWNAMGLNLVITSKALRIAVISIPMFHTAGLHCILFPTMFMGGKVVILPMRRGFNAANLAKVITDEKVTYTYMAPEMWTLLSQLPNIEGYDFSSMERGICAGGVLPFKTHDKLLKDIGLDVSTAYGLTEAGPIVIVATPEHKAKNPDTVGQPIFYPEIRLVDWRGKDVPVGEAGECVIRGPNVCQGYYKSPEVNKEYMKDGWAYTGDLLRMDKDKLYYFASRKKDMIKSGGENIFAAEVEDILNRHHKIMESAVIGVPHPKWGEGVKAIIVPKPDEILTETEVLEYCKTAMASYKKPQFIEFVKEIPKLATGKVDKVAVRKKYGALY